MNDQTDELKTMIANLAQEMQQGFERMDANQEKNEKRLSALERNTDDILETVKSLADYVAPLVERHDEGI